MKETHLSALSLLSVRTCLLPFFWSLGLMQHWELIKDLGVLVLGHVFIICFFKPLPNGETFILPPPKYTEPPNKRQNIGPGQPRKDKGQAHHLSVTAVTMIANVKDDAELH